MKSYRITIQGDKYPMTTICNSDNWTEIMKHVIKFMNEKLTLNGRLNKVTIIIEKQ